MRKLREDEHQTGAQILARAFDDDPYFRWMLPDAALRARWIEFIMRTMIEEDAGSIYAWDVDGALAGVLCSVEPNAWPHSIASRARAYLRAGSLPRPTARVVFSGLNAQRVIDKAHPDAPHWYVHALGVDPVHQGKGGGRALLSHVLARADEDGVIAYLETAKPENIDYYRRFGFEITTELATSKGAPPLWTMTKKISSA